MRLRATALLLIMACVLLLSSCGDVSGLFSGLSDSSLPPMTLPWAVKAVDLNGDGKIDLLDCSVNTKSNTPDQGWITVYLQNSLGGGTFQPASKYPAAAADPMQMTVGDLNGDGRPDVVTVNALLRLATSPNNISLLLQDGANPGHFLAAVNIDTGKSPRYAAIGDFNHDGRNDIAVATEEDVTLLVQNASAPGTFTRSSLAVGFADSVAIADLNGDGYNDIVSTNASVVTVSLQNPSLPGTFTAPHNFAADLRPAVVAVADLNADGRPDLVVLNMGDPMDGTTARVSILRQDPITHGNFLAPVNYKASRGLNAVAVGDLNGDGLPDLAVANGDGNVSVLLQSASGTFLPATQYAAKNSAGVQDVAIADVDGDGYNDLVFEAVDGINVRYQNASAHGTFGPNVLITK